MIKGLSIEWSLITSTGQELEVIANRHQIDCSRPVSDILIPLDLQTAPQGIGEEFTRGGKLYKTYLVRKRTHSSCT
jgi:hypothetical protein